MTDLRKHCRVMCAIRVPLGAPIIPMAYLNNLSAVSSLQSGRELMDSPEASLRMTHRLEMWRELLALIKTLQYQGEPRCSL
jgi:hypothetical protein